MKIKEAIARAICEADGVDPEKVVIGVGHRIPEGHQAPAWKVRLKQAEAALKVLGCHNAAREAIE